MAARLRQVDPDTIDGEDVFRWINDGDEDVLGVLDQFTRPIARMIMNLQFVYDPERFAIGGGISRQPKLLESIRRNLKQFYAWYPAKVPQAQVTVCRFFNEANLMGAYRNYVRTFGGFEGKKQIYEQCENIPEKFLKKIKKSTCIFGKG